MGGHVVTAGGDTAARGKRVLLEHPGLPGLPAAVEANGFVFVSALDGDRNADGSIDHASFGNGPAQARNAYAALVRTLEDVGLDGRSLVRVEHATASQDWRLQRMALWPEMFGTPTQAVSQGYQGRMVGQNMITVTGVAARPELERRVVAAGPDDGRAARIVSVGPFLFVIGVRGEEDLESGERAAEEEEGAFAQQVRIAYRNIDYWLGRAGAARSDLVRYDAFVRDINRAMEHRALRTDHFGGQMDVASTLVACPLGGRTDLELSAMALVPGQEKQVSFFGDRGDLARCVKAGGFVFASGMLGNRGVDSLVRADAISKMEPQLELARHRIEASLDSVGSSWSDIVRLDIYVRDPARQEVATTWLRQAFAADSAPAFGVYGVELEPGAEVELTAIAVAR